MIKKILGGLLILGGLFLLIGFPWVTKYQPEEMGKTGILIGIILLLIGIYLFLS